MKHPVTTIKPHDSIRHARELMEDRRYNQLPVVVNGIVVGIITDRDLRDAYPSVFDLKSRRANSRDPGDVPVDHVMTANVFTLGPNDTMEAGAELMRRERIGAIPIVERDRLVGILTRSDVLAAFAELAATTGRSPSAATTLSMARAVRTAM